MGNLDHLMALRAFEAAARNGSYVAAARELNVTPAAIGKQVRALEASLGIALFRRSKAGAARLSLTDQARAALPDLGEGFIRLAAGLRQLRQERGHATLTLAVTQAFAALWLLPRLDGFRTAHPGLALRLDVSDGVADYRSAGIDLGVRFGPGRWPGLAARLLAHDDAFPVCAPSLLDGPERLREPADLVRHTLIHDTAVHPDAGVPDWPTWLAAAGCSAVRSGADLHANATAACVQAAVAGQGVALGRGLLVADALAQGRLVRPFLAPSPSLRWSWFVVRPVEPETGTTDAVTAWLLAEAARFRPPEPGETGASCSANSGNTGE